MPNSPTGLVYQPPPENAKPESARMTRRSRPRLSSRGRPSSCSRGWSRPPGSRTTNWTRTARCRPARRSCCRTVAVRERVDRHSAAAAPLFLAQTVVALQNEVGKMMSAPGPTEALSATKRREWVPNEVSDSAEVTQSGTHSTGRLNPKVPGSIPGGGILPSQNAKHSMRFPISDRLSRGGAGGPVVAPGAAAS
jgi:hypothetical protein